MNILLEHEVLLIAQSYSGSWTLGAGKGQLYPKICLCFPLSDRKQFTWINLHLLQKEREASTFCNCTRITLKIEYRALS